MASTSPNTEASTPASLQSSFEQGVALSLHLWPALSLAVQNNWGGPDSSDKRDWFAGAIVDLFPDLSKLPSLPTPSAQPQQPQQASVDEPDQAEIETVLLQVMLDEFEVNVDDDSAFEVAEEILRVRAECLKGGEKMEELEGLKRRFEKRKGQKIVGVLEKGEEDEETDWDSDDDEEGSENGDGDVEMGDAPPVKQKEAPEVDEDGFTTVTRKKR